MKRLEGQPVSESAVVYRKTIGESGVHDVIDNTRGAIMSKLEKEQNAMFPEFGEVYTMTDIEINEVAEKREHFVGTFIMEATIGSPRLTVQCTSGGDVSYTVTSLQQDGVYKIYTTTSRSEALKLLRDEYGNTSGFVFGVHDLITGEGFYPVGDFVYQKRGDLIIVREGKLIMDDYLDSTSSQQDRIQAVEKWIRENYSNAVLTYEGNAMVVMAEEGTVEDKAEILAAIYRNITTKPSRIL